MGKRRKGQNPSSGVLPPGSAWAAGLALLAAVGYLGLRSTEEVQAPPERSAEELARVEAAEGELERLGMVRSALFSAAPGKAGRAAGPAGFASADYWEDTYQASERQYDWLATWTEGVRGVQHSALKDLVAPSLPGARDIAVLNLGCGNSRLAEEMYDDGYQNITNVDISPAVVKKMRARNLHRDPQMQYLQMDISSMSFHNESFDLVIEKGTLDALYTGALHLIPLAVDEAWRVLRPGGLFVSVTFGGPRSRRQLFKPRSHPGWASRGRRTISRAGASADSQREQGRQHGDIYVYLLRKALPGEAVPELTAEEREDRPRRMALEGQASRCADAEAWVAFEDWSAPAAAKALIHSKEI